MATIEKRGRNCWRVGVQLSIHAGIYARAWVRRSFSYPEGMSEADQRREVEIEAMRLQVDVADGRATPANPYALPEDKAPGTVEQLYTGRAYMSRTSAAARQAPASGASLTVRQLYDIWMRDHVIPNTSPVTANGYSTLFKLRILPVIGDTRLCDLTPLMLTQLINSIAADTKRPQSIAPELRVRVSDRTKLQQPTGRLSDSSVRDHYDALNYMFNKAVQWDILPTNPMCKVNRPRVRRKKTHYLDDDQAVELLRKLADEPNIYFRAAVLLALLCGLRLGEIGALTLDDIDWKNGRIDISRALKYTSATGQYIAEPKTDTSERVIDLPAGMMTILHVIRDYQVETAALLGDRWRGTGRILINFDGTPVHHDTPSKQWRRFADRNGYAGVRFHDLRHPYVKHTTKNKSLQKQKSQAINRF